MENNILTLRREGLYCKAGDFYVDPRGKVDWAIITHAHSDHARAGHKNYLCSDSCKSLLQVRIGQKNGIESIYFERLNATSELAR